MLQKLAALCELGKALETTFLCECLRQEPLRREIHEGLNVIENWNSANSFILYGKGGEFASNRLEDQEILMLSLHLLQVSLVFINMLMIQQVLEEEGWRGRPTAVDLRASLPSGGSTLTHPARLPSTCSTGSRFKAPPSQHSRIPCRFSHLR